MNTIFEMVNKYRLLFDTKELDKICHPMIERILMIERGKIEEAGGAMIDIIASYQYLY